ncbi:MAG: hypothetical protein J7J20_00590 [Desulfurococcales archaeon]|nr:hypothetical protein [Desulfurococcales archaeon]
MGGGGISNFDESKIRSYVNKLVSEFSRDILKELRSIPSETNRFLYFLAWLNTKLEEWRLGRIVIVRGFSVEFYTRASIRTIDVDVVILGSSTATAVVRRFLDAVGSIHEGRVYVLAPLRHLLSKAIDLVDDNLANRRLVVVEIGGYRVYIQSPEDTLVYTLNAWKFWKSSEDELRARVLVEVLKNKLNEDYLCCRAEEEGVIDKLREAGMPCRREKR